MKKVLFIAVLAGSIGCGNPSSEKVDSTEANEVTTQSSEEFFGEKINAEGALSAADFKTQMENKDSMKVKVTASINGTCVKKGCWMNVDLGDSSSMMVRFKDYGFFVPKEGQEGKQATFEGVAYHDTVTVKMLQHYAEDAGKSQEEIDAITEPKITLAFEATGVIIEDVN